MKDVIVDETMGDMDKDNTGFISVEEYIGEPRPSLVATPTVYCPCTYSAVLIYLLNTPGASCCTTTFGLP